jgi:branched-chain amino acid transport system permease protein
VGLAVVVAGIVLAMVRVNPYIYFAGCVVLQYVVIATAWNILGGYAGYVNFGTPAFFAMGAYTAVFLIQSVRAPLPVLLLAGGLVAALLGLGIGYLTLRLRGVFFSIATLALSVVLQTMIMNWDYVGGSRGMSVLRPSGPPFGSYVTFLFTVMVGLAVIAVLVARFIERSWIGRGLAALRDNEEAAECMGVPTLRLKLFATTISGFLLGVAGAPFPYYVTFVEPNSAFALDYAVNALAMPMIGGTTSWVGPLVGALLLGIIQQVATVTISSAVNLLIVGLLLVGFVIVAPKGIIGLVQDFMRERVSDGGRPTWRSRLAIFANMRPGAR